MWECPVKDQSSKYYLACIWPVGNFLSKCVPVMPIKWPLFDRTCSTVNSSTVVLFVVGWVWCLKCVCISVVLRYFYDNVFSFRWMFCVAAAKLTDTCVALTFCPVCENSHRLLWFALSDRMTAFFASLRRKSNFISTVKTVEFVPL